jgi:uncharacterized membrane protein
MTREIQGYFTLGLLIVFLLWDLWTAETKERLQHKVVSSIFAALSSLLIGWLQRGGWWR